MTEMTNILMRILEIAERVSTMEEIPTAVLGIFGIVLVFGILNCVLGYRLLRFWVMLFGFAGGALAGLFLVRSMGVEDKMVYLGAMVGIGIALGVVSFLIYKLGIFVLGAGIGMTLSIYILHPTTSFIFFLCILIGAAAGALGVRFAREVIIVGTSLLGGVMAGYSLTKLGGLPEFPYGIALSIAFVVLGLLVQFATNRRRGDEEDEAAEKMDERTGDPAYIGTDEKDVCDEKLYGGYEDFGDDMVYDDEADFVELPPVRNRKRTSMEEQEKTGRKRSGR